MINVMKGKQCLFMLESVYWLVCLCFSVSFCLWERRVVRRKRQRDTFSPSQVETFTYQDISKAIS